MLSGLIASGVRRQGLRATQATLRAGLPGIGGELRFERAPTSQVEEALQLEASLATLAGAAADAGSGVVLTIDEAQLARRADLGGLAAALQAGTRADWPYVVVFAGLDTMRLANRSVTYMERGEWHEIGLLDDASTLAALTVPAEHAGRPLDLAAAQFLAKRTGGYPYAVQLYGHHAWLLSEGSATIDLADAEAAAGHAARDLEAGLYATRWAQASGRERGYLLALAQLLTDGGPATSGDVARRLGTTAQRLSSYRQRLLTKGTIVAEPDRTLRFAVPGMADYVSRQAAEVDVEI